MGLFSKVSQHHKLPDSRGGAFTNPNMTGIKSGVHESIHKLFENQHTIEKVNSIISMDEAILKDQFKYLIMDILDTDVGEVFKSEAFKSEKSRKYLKYSTPAREGLRTAKKKNIKSLVLSEYRLFGKGSDSLEKMTQIISMDALILEDYFRKEIMQILGLDRKDVFVENYMRCSGDYEWWGDLRND